MGDRTLYTTTGDGKKLHLKRDCRQLIKAKTVREARVGEVETLELCRRCDPSVEIPNPTGYEHMRSLREAAQEEQV